jgi:biopolymer transport protein ExbD
MGRRAWILIGVAVAMLLGGSLRTLDLLFEARAAEEKTTTLLKTLERPPMLLVFGRQIWLNNEPVTWAGEVQQPSTDPKIGPLFQRLERQRELWKVVNPDKQATAIEICADEKITFGLLKRIIHTSALVGYVSVRLGRLKVGSTPESRPPLLKVDSCSGVVLSTHALVRATPERDLPPEKMLHLAMLVRAEGYVIAAAGDRLEIPGKGGDLSGKLGKQVSKIRTGLPQKKDILLAAEDDVVQRDVMTALEACRATGLSEISLTDPAGVEVELPSAS